MTDPTPALCDNCDSRPAERHCPCGDPACDLTICRRCRKNVISNLRQEVSQ